MKRSLVALTIAVLTFSVVLLLGQHKGDSEEIARLENEINKFEIERARIDATVKEFAAYCMAAYATNDCIRSCVEVQK